MEITSKLSNPFGTLSWAYSVKPCKVAYLTHTASVRIDLRDLSSHHLGLLGCLDCESMTPYGVWETANGVGSTRHFPTYDEKKGESQATNIAFRTIRSGGQEHV